MLVRIIHGVVSEHDHTISWHVAYHLQISVGLMAGQPRVVEEILKSHANAHAPISHLGGGVFQSGHGAFGNQFAFFVDTGVSTWLLQVDIVAVREVALGVLLRAASEI